MNNKKDSVKGRATQSQSDDPFWNIQREGGCGCDKPAIKRGERPRAARSYIYPFAAVKWIKSCPSKRRSFRSEILPLFLSARQRQSDLRDQTHRELMHRPLQFQKR